MYVSPLHEGALASLAEHGAFYGATGQMERELGTTSHLYKLGFDLGSTPLHWRRLFSYI